MLTRVLENESMDTLQEALEYDGMAHDEVNRQFVDDLLVPEPLAGEVLDLGTGTARIPIELCRRAPGVRVLAVDLSASMLIVARNNVELAGATRNILLDRVDAKRLPYEDGRFAAVLSNSIVHHIARPEAMLAEAVRVVAPGGLLFLRDLLRPADEQTLRQLVGTYAGGETDAAQQMFASSLRAALTLHEWRNLTGELGFPDDAVRQTSDRHVTWMARKGATGSAEKMSAP